MTDTHTITDDLRDASNSLEAAGAELWGMATGQLEATYSQRMSAICRVSNSAILMERHAVGV
jgi:hypothetical protein